MKAKNRNASPQYSMELLESRIAPATFVVTNLNDAGAGSLRQAILDANGTAAADTIAFKAGLQGTIELTTGEMGITENLTIQGPGAGKLKIDANEVSRIFNIDDGTNVLKEARISGLFLANATIPSEGGAIFGTESLVLKNCVVSGSTSGGDGGGVYVNNTGNTDVGFVTVSGCKIFGNSTGGVVGEGGGLAVHTAGDVTVKNSVFRGNSAGTAGGVYIHVIGGPGHVLVKSSTIASNDASNNAGGARFVTDDAGEVRIVGSTIRGNQAAGEGGGLSFGGGAVKVSGSTISSNVANGGSGGGIVVDAVSFEIINSELRNNLMLGSGGGGGLFAQGAGAPVRIVNTLFQGNLANGIGGGMAAAFGAEVTVSKATFEGNLSGGGGGGIGAIYGATLHVAGSTFIENSASLGGGAIAGDGTGTNAVDLQITASTFVHNRTDDNGGAVALVGDGDLKISGSKFKENSAAQSGGGIFVELAGITDISDSRFSGNSAVLAGGGGIYLAGNGSKTITRSTIAGNVAHDEGGGILFENGVLEIISSKIKGNISGIEGGGIENSSASGVNLIATVVAGNVAPVDPDKSGSFLP